MSLSAKLRRAPTRIVTGAFILNSGVGKLGADEGTAKQLHGLATGTYPFLGKVDPKLFTKGLAVGEIALGGVVLLPIVPPVVAGLGLVGFSGALLNMWWNTDGMHEPGSPRPTVQGVGIAKDVWMLGIGASLVADSLLEPAHDKKVEIVAGVSSKRADRGRKARKAKKQAKKANNELLKRATEAATHAQAEVGKRAAKAGAKAQKQALKASAKATKAVADARTDYAPVVAEKAKQARDAAKSLADEYGPVAAEKAKQARQAAQDLADTYGPVAAEKAKQARQAAQDLADTYGPVAADYAKQARDAATDVAGRARAAAAR
ncbi:hypothetical protein [uncultured Jatrophihabitans sp.]|uniref:hypothetical protein n=1 Tax=uncultured Jatrophihabitans sp. TaxID=1610747 RepID=UPI0035CC727A